jgi:hypothetical protein
LNNSVLVRHLVIRFLDSQRKTTEVEPHIFQDGPMRPRKKE